jgi:methylthioribose-1-phosphate isomerase
MGVALGAQSVQCSDQQEFRTAVLEICDHLAATRPTAVNLFWAIERMKHVVDTNNGKPVDEIKTYLVQEAIAIQQEDIAMCRSMGQYGAKLIQDGQTILTHCNAGALATINWGTATAPIYVARQRGIDVHVWVDETRPRNQGSQLTCWELARNEVPHTLIVDNAGGHLMQRGQVDICITGTDRTTRTGDVANKIGTYLKALAAHDNGIPCYVALPSTTIDWTIQDGMTEIPIEERDTYEVSHVRGMRGNDVCDVKTVAEGSAIRNYAFDVTPARLITGLITERGICEPSEEGLGRLFPNFAKRAS